MSSIADKLRKLKNANYLESEILTLPDKTQLILSTLNGEEDLEIANYLREYMDKSLGHYTKIETIAYAIKWLKTPDGDEINLRGVQTIETGEMLNDSTPVRVKRHVFMRELISTWPDVILDTLLTKFAIMMEDLEKDASKLIRIELADSTLQVKIMSLKEELQELLLDAQSRGISIEEDLKFILPRPINKADTDALLEALKKQEIIPDEKYHPIDEQLVKEMDENPEVYPVQKVRR